VAGVCWLSVPLLAAIAVPLVSNAPRLRRAKVFFMEILLS
jgi:hypothetical protein